MKFTPRNIVRAFVCLAIMVNPTALCAGQTQRGDISLTALARIDRAVAESIAKKELPGAVVLAGRRGRVAWRKAYGNRAVEPAAEPMTADTVFDMASVTKVVATATSIMILVERGYVRLSDSITRHIPEIKGDSRERITVEMLLTHRSGYAPDFDLRERWTGYDEAMKRLHTEMLRNQPGARFVYSDIGFIALGEIVRRVSGKPLDQFAAENIFRPLGMKDTGFNPPASLRARIAPTEKRKGQMSYLGDTGANAGQEGERWLRGEVHDPTAFRMNGVAGHAGLFSTADDLAKYCRMILNSGSLDGARVLSPMTIAAMTRPRVVADDGSTRGLGFDINTSYSANRGDLFPLGTFGHTGFTGTSIWLDPVTESFVVFLSNRVHPDGKGDVGALRGRVASIVAGAITDSTALRLRQQWLAQMQDASMNLARLASSRAPAPRESATALDAVVLNGIDVLERDGFRQIEGMRVGLVTNHTGRNRNGKQTIDVLREAPNVRLVALFAPEHGIRGVMDEKVSDSTDEKTGLPIYSLYGDTRRPKQEQLSGLDAIVYDIQDIGTRFYTYETTLGYVMEEAAKAKLPVFVLDRPNPIGGAEIEGPLADADKLSFIGYHTVPVRHGLTIGELGRLFNEQRKIGCDLRVIRMEGWRRAMLFDSTNQTWVNPSPNMRSLTEALLYPGIGLLETTNVSVGRGTDTPFEVVGAPWIDGQRLAAALNARGIEGVRFVPVRFKPTASVFRGEECGGINIIITDRARFKSVRTGLEIAVALRRLFGDQWKIDSYARLLLNAATLTRLRRGDAADEIETSWGDEIRKFRTERARFELYR